MIQPHSSEFGVRVRDSLLNTSYVCNILCLKIVHSFSALWSIFLALSFLQFWRSHFGAWIQLYCWHGRKYCRQLIETSQCKDILQEVKKPAAEEVTSGNWKTHTQFFYIFILLSLRLTFSVAVIMQILLSFYFVWKSSKTV